MPEEDEFEVASATSTKSSRRKYSLAPSSVVASEAGTLAAGEDEREGEGEEEEDAAAAAGVLAAVLPAEEVQTLMEKAKWYTSMCLGTTSILSVFAFLFAIPFVVEPAISTILADFSPDAVACVMSSHIWAEGLRNCTWSSCREGCTAAVTSCHKIRVNYTKILYEEVAEEAPDQIPWDVIDTKFFINAEGCGYPDTGVNCTIFAKKYGKANPGKIFPCYYSKVYPETVVSKYSWDENLRNLILAITIPILLFIISTAILCYWYCLPQKKSCGSPGQSLIDKYDTKEDILEEDFGEEDEEEY